MEEKTKYDIMCIERGDVDYLRYVADQLNGSGDLQKDQLDNLAKALIGIASSACELDQISKIAVQE